MHETLAPKPAGGLGAPSPLLRKSVCDLSAATKPSPPAHPQQQDESDPDSGRNKEPVAGSPRLSVTASSAAAPAPQKKAGPALPDIRPVPIAVEETHSGHLKMPSKHDTKLKSTDNVAAIAMMLFSAAAHSRNNLAADDGASGLSMARSKSGLSLDAAGIAEGLAKRPSLMRLDTSPAILPTGDARRPSVAPPQLQAASTTDSRGTSSVAPPLVQPPAPGGRRRSSTVPSAFASPFAQNRRTSALPPEAEVFLSTDSRRASTVIPPPSVDSRRGSALPPIASDSRRLSTLPQPAVAESRRSSTIPPVPSDSRRASALPPSSILDSRRASALPPPASDSRRASTLPPPVAEGRRASMLLQETPGVSAAKAFFGAALGYPAASQEPAIVIGGDQDDEEDGRFPGITIAVTGDNDNSSSDDDAPTKPPPVIYRRGSTIPLAAISAAGKNGMAKSRSLLSVAPVAEVTVPEEKGPREHWTFAITAVLSTRKMQRAAGGAGANQGAETAEALAAKKGDEYMLKWNREEFLFLTRQLALNKPIMDFIKRRDRGDKVSTDRVREFLRRLMPFKKYNELQLDKLARCVGYEQHAKGSLILRQGHIPSHVYVVLSGEVHVVVQKNKDDPGLVVNSIKAGQGFGELAILRRTTRMSSIKCAMWSEFLRIHKDDYINILADDVLTSGSTTIAIMDQLSKLPILRGIAEETLIKLAVSAEIIEFEPGQIVLKEDELQNRSLYFVLQGQARATKNLAASKPDSPKKRAETTFEVCKLADNDFFPSLRIHKQTLNEAFLEEFGVYFNLLNTGLDECNNVTEKFRRAYADKTANVTVKAKTSLIVLRCQRLEFLRIITEDIYTAIRRKGYVMEVTEEDLEKQYEHSENWSKYKKAVLTEVGSGKK